MGDLLILTIERGSLNAAAEHSTIPLSASGSLLGVKSAQLNRNRVDLFEWGVVATIEAYLEALARTRAQLLENGRQSNAGWV